MRSHFPLVNSPYMTYNNLILPDFVPKNVEKHKKRRRRAAAVALFAAALLLAAFFASVRAPDPAPDTIAAPARSQTVRVVTADTAQPEETASDVSDARSRRAACYNILVSGRDDAGGGSDTNLLVRFDASARRVDAVSLPRDTLLHHEWYSNKLNYASASGGVELLRSEVENLLGVPIDYTISVDLKGFVALVDAIGGVDFDVPADMDYDDPAQELHIHFAQGRRHLNGREAMEVVRWRKNNDGGGYADADIGRIATQQAFLRAAAAKALRLQNLGALARTFFACVRTDLTPGNLVWLAGEAARLDADDLHFYTLPGDGAGCYRRESVYVLDPEATLALVNEALNPYDRPIGPEELDILNP